MKSFRRLGALVLVLALVAAACGDDDAVTTTTAPAQTTTTAAATTTQPSADPVTIVIGTTDSIAGLDSADAYAVHDWELIRNTGQGLMTWESGTAEIAPGLAESFDVSPDGTVFTFYLRSDAAFWDGTPLTAQDYVTHINRMLELDGDGGVGGSLGKPYIEAVEATDDFTVVFTLTGAYGYFPQVVTGAPYYPMHPDYPTDALVTFPDAPWGGVGPWMVTSFDIGEQTVLEPNPYWYGDPPGVDRIIIRYYTDAQGLVQALQTGDIDVAWRSVTEPALLEALANTDGIVSAEVPGGGIRYLIMNRNAEPADDENVRQAIAAAINRTEIVDLVFGGNAQELYSPIPPGFLGSNEAFDDAYDSPNVDLAVQLLAESGYTADNPLSITLEYPPNRYGGVVADAVQVMKQQLEATGVMVVDTNPTEWATYVGQCISGAYPICFLGWFFDYPDSSNYVEPFTLFGGLGTGATDEDNVPAPGHEDLIDLINQAATTVDSAQRAALYEQVQHLYAELVVTVPLWFEPERVFYWDYISADPSAGSAASLNIGPPIEMQYRLLRSNK
jgi:peptide/nickel transport system substrate-binding protein